MKPLIQLSIFNLSEELKNALKTILDDVELEKLKLEKELREIKHVNLNLKIENEELKKCVDSSRSEADSRIKALERDAAVVSKHVSLRKKNIFGRQGGRTILRKLRKKMRSRLQDPERVKSEKLLIIRTLNRENDEFYPDPEGPYFVYPDHDHPNRPQKVNDFIFISMKSDNPNSYEPDKILHPFMNMIAINEVCANEIIAYLDETGNPEQVLCSNLIDYTSSNQGKGFLFLCW